MGTRLTPAVFAAVVSVVLFFPSLSPAEHEDGGLAQPFLDRKLEWEAPSDAGSGPSAVFHELSTMVRDGRISRSHAGSRMREILPRIAEDYYARGGKDFPRDQWVFPVEGVSPRAIGGRNDEGYKARGYDYFDGNRHGGHPSFDIFIRDRNRDFLDDGTGKPVRVRSMTEGMVVSVEKEWQAGSRLRGGNYIWIYNPSEKALVYYAHNRNVLVRVGDIVAPGDPIATVGRSGQNAWKARSPTHLHLTFLKVEGGYPVPVNIYPILRQCRPAKD